MKITRTSMMTGVVRTLDIDVTQEQVKDWEEGALIQDAMPHITPAEREFMLTGITGEEWQMLEMLEGEDDE